MTVFEDKRRVSVEQGETGRHRKWFEVSHALLSGWHQTKPKYCRARWLVEVPGETSFWHCESVTWRTADYNMDERVQSLSIGWMGVE